MAHRVMHHLVHSDTLRLVEAGCIESASNHPRPKRQNAKTQRWHSLICGSLQARHAVVAFTGAPQQLCPARPSPLYAVG
jgi:hypothetical protein